MPVSAPASRGAAQGRPAQVDEEAYAYDPAANPVSQTSTRLGSAGSSETQCFRYDGLDRLTAAWTATDDCAATPTAGSHSTVGDGLGAASAYWTTWAYDTLGDMTSQDKHALPGGTDTTTTDTFGGSSGGPHALTTAATTGGSTSTSAFSYDPAGNMTGRTTPATGTQTLTWDNAGNLATITGTSGVTSHTYTPDGSRSHTLRHSRRAAVQQLAHRATQAGRHPQHPHSPAGPSPCSGGSPPAAGSWSPGRKSTPG